MAKLSKTKLGFKIEGNFYSLISITENRSKELLIFPSFTENYSEIESGNPNAEDPIKNQHYTIHNSPNSIEKINVLKHTLETLNSEPKITRIFTRAFKQNNLLSPLYISRCPNILVERYRTNRNERDTYIELGDFNSRRATVFYMVVAGNNQISFKGILKDINVHTVCFQTYSVTILWSYVMIPSHYTELKVHFMTLPEYDCQLKQGFSQNEIIDLYRMCRQGLQQSFLNLIQSELEFNEEDMNLLKSIKFKKNPDLS